MKKEAAIALVVKYTEGKATPDEKILVEGYLLAYMNGNTALPDHLTIDSATRETWDLLQNHIHGSRQSTRVMRFNRLAIAASLFIALGIGLFFGISHINEDKDLVVVVNEVDVMPGKNSATLTMNDGTAIHLSDVKSGIVIGKAELKYNDSSAVESPNKSADFNQLMTISTPRGGTYKVTLNDGTKVWLNAGSSLKFPAHFRGEEKRVELTGEAYFEVAKVAPRSKPFVVVTDKQQVQVLGTHFNVNSYSDESSTITTLLEGVVRVSAVTAQTNGRAKETTATLSPNQQSELSDAGIQVSSVNAEGVAAWTEGYFDFNEEKLERIMNKIGRWYDVRIVYDDPSLKEQTFTGNISKFSKVSEVLKKLALSKVVRFKIDGRTITVRK